VKYRADIDGLRALAIIPVLFYHVGVPGFGGGFVGVDIFLVISGYLICGMIDADIRDGTFSLGDFYKRRILRILPSLLVMLLVTSVLAYLYFLPVELQDYSKSLAGAIGSVSNVYFAQTAGYFDGPAETKPLLHTWSLGVEEQFYFIVPLLMLLAARFAPKRAKLRFQSAPCFPLRRLSRSAIATGISCSISRRSVPGSLGSARYCRSGSFDRRKQDSFERPVARSG
jgi:peptidoglycan/LPS O-acetylase OafA/YrhL